MDHMRTFSYTPMTFHRWSETLTPVPKNYFLEKYGAGKFFSVRGPESVVKRWAVVLPLEIDGPESYVIPMPMILDTRGGPAPLYLGSKPLMKLHDFGVIDSSKLKEYPSQPSAYFIKGKLTYEKRAILDPVALQVPIMFEPIDAEVRGDGCEMQPIY